MKILQEVPVEFDDGSYEFLGQDKVKSKLSGGHKSKKNIYLIQAGDLEDFLNSKRQKSSSKGMFGKLKSFFGKRKDVSSNNDSVVLDNSSKVRLKNLLIDLMENQDHIEQNKLICKNDEFFFSTKLSYELKSSLVVFRAFLDNGIILVVASLSNGVLEPVMGVKKNRRYAKRLDLDFFFKRLPELYFTVKADLSEEKEQTFMAEVVDVSFEGMGIVLAVVQEENLDSGLKEEMRVSFPRKEFETRFESLSFEIPSGTGTVRWIKKDTEGKGQIRAGLKVNFSESIDSQHYKMQCWKAKQLKLQNNR